MGIACYTCITGGYDSLKSLPSIQQDGIDFICFSDDDHLQCNGWKVLPMPNELRGLSNVKKQRIVKICPHRYLKDYETSVWIDGSFQIVGDVAKFVQQYDLEKTPLHVRVHPRRRCIFEEAAACINFGFDSREVVESQMQKYKSEGYPKNVGLAETGIILRKHNDAKCQLVDNLWASEVLRGSCRDQLSFNYACWKMHFLPGCLSHEFNIGSSSSQSAQTFILCAHKKKRFAAK